MTSTLYPFVLEPVYKDYIWGGNQIPSIFTRQLPPGIYAESWELSDRPEGMSIVTNGAFNGSPLKSLVARFGHELLGHGVCSTHLPLLVKLIDSRERLSIQVHPDNESAARVKGEAKTEAWHVLAAEPNAKVFAGMKKGITPQNFREALNSGNLEACLNAIPVKSGDTIFIPGGRVHAIGEGLLILEVQQNSNTTYRVYDWGRVGHDGKPRELHIEQALKVIRFEDNAPVKTAPWSVSDGPHVTATALVECPFFRLEQITLTDRFEVHHDGSGFHAIFTTNGPVTIEAGQETVTVPHGRTCLIPALLNRYTIRSNSPNTKLLRITLPSSPT
jgi:mannose-6-phosphate isomerase